MSKLQFYTRPQATFDPTDADHRKWFAQYQKTRSWSKCPVKFVVNSDSDNVVGVMTQMLLEYYTEKDTFEKSSYY